MNQTIPIIPPEGIEVHHEIGRWAYAISSLACVTIGIYSRHVG